MILIDLNKPELDIIVTLTSDLPTQFIGVENPTYIMVLTNVFSHKVFEIPLANNISINQQRYDHYRIDTTTISTLETGFYSYEIYFISIQDSNLIETGTANVLGAGMQNNTIIFNEAGNSDFIVFNK
ncbi:hypothetical protein BDD43_2844 [Mucilaginibacter gracilis]|uniref:Uncharacterized protein n=1 Tax=Mucilaginibacter gracilis TaxID=423350 RepID=A0A495J3S7_9SPHI|nr:hypothetical protein [Mucilaginibacter gracilis]RKR82659.1 hypothetical protein BDD43_2844 [Mucilaginibacter gracilis]